VRLAGFPITPASRVARQSHVSLVGSGDAELTVEDRVQVSIVGSGSMGSGRATCNGVARGKARG
jgi:hypothetical protein